MIPDKQQQPHNPGDVWLETVATAQGMAGKEWVTALDLDYRTVKAFQWAAVDQESGTVSLDCFVLDEQGRRKMRPGFVLAPVKIRVTALLTVQPDVFGLEVSK